MHRGLNIRILGPVEASVGDEPVTLAGKEKALLAALALEAPRTMSLDHLSDVLWEGDPPESANVSLRVFVSRLRKALAAAGADGRLVTRSPGYALVLAAGDTLDVAEFDAHLRARRYDDALALWRGSALGEVAELRGLAPEAARLEERRLEAIEARLDSALAAGRHREVVAELEALCRVHPLRERFWAQRMVALYRAGRQADALRAYQDVRSRLAEELGLEPSADLVALEAAVLAQDPDLEAPAPTPSGPPSPEASLPSGVVTFVLTDIEGSTAMWDAHGSAMAAALEIHDDLVEEVVSANDGVVLKAKGEGDATLSVFRRASDGVAAAAALQSRLLATVWPTPAPIRVRIGIHTGEAHERDGDYYGPTLNRAARLRGLAAGGETVISQATAELVHDRLPDGTALVEVGARALAGVSRPEQVFALDCGATSAVDEPEPLPLPPALVPQTAAISFVGREAELGRIAAAWATAKSGRRDALLISGEPGIGKTALATASARAAHAEGAIVLFGHCDEESLVPFQPFVEAIAHWVRSASVGELRATLGVQAADAALLVPEIADRLPGLPRRAGGVDETERYRLFEAVPAVVRALARRAPVVLVLDDLHWADRPTLSLLVHLIRRTPDVPFLVLGTYRDTDLVRTHPLAETLVDLRRADVVSRLLLRGLSLGEVRSLVCGPGEPSTEAEALAEELWSETDGSPLFLRESLRHLVESEAVVALPDGGFRPVRRIPHLGIPEGVKEVIGRRLTRLSDECNRVLRAASVLGREFSAEVIGRTAGVATDDVLDALDEAATAGVVEEVPKAVGQFSFTHALVREALYDELSLTRRVRMHQAVAAAIEALFEDDLDQHLAELAFHYGQSAVAGSADKALEYARRAGDRDMAASAYEEAARHFGMALEVADEAGADAAVRADLLCAIGQAQWLSRDHKVARATFDRAAGVARDLGDSACLAQAALGYAGAGIRLIWVDMARRDPRAIELLEEAEQALPRDDSAIRARVLACLGSEVHFDDSARAAALTSNAVAMARRLGEEATLGYVLCARNLAIMGSDPRERLNNASEALELAELVADRRLEAFGRAHRHIALLELDDVEGARREHAAATELADRLHDPVFIALNAFAESVWAQLEGRWDDAQQAQMHAWEVGQDAGDPNLIVLIGVCQMSRLWLQNRLAELVGLFEVAANDGFFERLWGIPSSTVHAFISAESGKTATAKEALDREVADGWTTFKRAPAVAFVYFLVASSRAAALVAHESAARQLYDLLLPFEGLNAAMGGVTCLGSVDHALGMLAAVLGHDDTAKHHFDTAVARYETNGWMPLLADVRLHYASSLVRTGDRSAAKQLSLQALETARTLGMAAIQEHAQTLLVQLGDDRISSSRVARTSVSRRDRWRAKATAGGRRAFARIVGSDVTDEVTRRFTSPLAQKVIFTAMARGFQPSMAFGFEGDFQFELRHPTEGLEVIPSDWWTIEIRGRKATARRGRSSSPVATLHVDLADFLRMASGQPVYEPVFDGRMRIDGDFTTFSRLSDLFGMLPPFEALVVEATEE